MKTNTLLVCIVTLALGSRAAIGQGTVLFNNNSAGRVMVASTPPMALEQSGRAQLVYAPAGYPAWVPCRPYSTLGACLSANPYWTLAVPTAPFTAPGIFSGSVLTLDGIKEGEPIQYVVLAWTSLAPTFDAALGSGEKVGISEMFTTYTGTASNPVNIADSFGGMTIPLIPEPSAFALAGLGGAVIWLFRREKKGTGVIH